MDTELAIQLLCTAANDARPVRVFFNGGSFDFTALDRMPPVDKDRGVIQLVGFPAPSEGYAEGRLMTLYLSLNDITGIVMDFDFAP